MTRNPMKTSALLLALSMLGCAAPVVDFDDSDIPPPPTSTVTQSLSACLNGDGRNITCSDANQGACSGWGGPEGNCYCPGPTASEDAYCANQRNCSRPEYPQHCRGGCLGAPIWTHWCVSGQMP